VGQKYARFVFTSEHPPLLNTPFRCFRLSIPWVLLSPGSLRPAVPHIETAAAVRRGFTKRDIQRIQRNISFARSLLLVTSLVSTYLPDTPSNYRHNPYFLKSLRDSTTSLWGGAIPQD
jgi:hypothetical protein